MIEKQIGLSNCLRQAEALLRSTSEKEREEERERERERDRERERERERERKGGEILKKI